MCSPRVPATLLVAIFFFSSLLIAAGTKEPQGKPDFHTSDRCVACHNQLITPTGRDISIGIDWHSSIMANSSRDPYWQASVRRELTDHAVAKVDVEDECSLCHMPITRYEEARVNNGKGRVFAYLPFSAHQRDGKALQAEDGVSCAVCHQISNDGLGSRESFNGGFVVKGPDETNSRHEYGPFAIAPGHQHIMESSTGGYQPVEAQHIRESALCASCHQLYTTALGENGKAMGHFPEQMPYLEWLHSDFPGRYTCQQCHMTPVDEEASISSVLGVPRSGIRQHVFFGGNFFVQRMLNQYRDELNTAALPQHLSNAAEGTLRFLHDQAARIELENVVRTEGQLQVDVHVVNLTGHKLPTAYPSRRAWIHLTVRDRDGHRVFESGALNPDGSIVGNDNDADKRRYEPHYSEITSPDQVQIYEPILKDFKGEVTTGLLSAVGYLKDNRLLPSGFDKQTAAADIAVYGGAADDPRFVAGSHTVRYSVATGGARGPFHIQAELWYQPIGFRWAHNLEPYQAEETQRFVRYYSSMSGSSGTVLARAEATR